METRTALTNTGVDYLAKVYSQDGVLLDCRFFEYAYRQAAIGWLEARKYQS